MDRRPLSRNHVNSMGDGTWFLNHVTSSDSRVKTFVSSGSTKIDREFYTKVGIAKLLTCDLVTQDHDGPTNPH